MIKPPEASRRQTCGCRIANRLDEHYDPARFHSTMLRLGSELDWPPAALARLSETFDAVRFDPFAITFDQIEAVSCAAPRARLRRAFTRRFASMRKAAACSFPNTLSGCT
ncbi:hypothetical protein [Sphingomonas immobilis]|uniref:Uncharacterized protein n=1 Tax=Sphingomonas immobilis TaxID=3063997 RepID=A0ABT8ZWK4_9SPHN|nr:hypothetical protein [Sphingomonas sp. CA1-15]MDO7841592.1 hypothetical protein [Sphingomonas sp. CA1-15]